MRLYFLCKFNFSIGKKTMVVSKILHVSWDKETEQNMIANGTLSIEIPIDEEKKKTAETALKETLNETTNEKTQEKRKKRSLSSGDTLPVVQPRV